MFIFFSAEMRPVPPSKLTQDTHDEILEFSQVELSKLTQTALWIGSGICALLAIFGTYPWNSGNYPSEGWKV